jgi:glycosyltransferase A (GT-A) superfamily protein (DUF2064 family)
MALARIGHMLGRIYRKTADELLSQPGWRDDRIYDQTRRKFIEINIATILLPTLADEMLALVSL